MKSKVFLFYLLKICQIDVSPCCSFVVPFSGTRDVTTHNAPRVPVAPTDITETDPCLATGLIPVLSCRAAANLSYCVSRLPSTSSTTTTAMTKHQKWTTCTLPHPPRRTKGTAGRHQQRSRPYTTTHSAAQQNLRGTAANIADMRTLHTDMLLWLVCLFCLLCAYY